MAAKPSKIHIRMIEVLRKHPRGITFGQWRKALGLRPDEQGQLDRRKRDLYRWYIIEKVHKGGDVYYLYKGEHDKPPTTGGISQKRRAAILHKAGGRCGMCGRTVEKHRVTLVLDHRLPRNWGGTDEPENLWAICEECNAGKKDYFASQDEALMRQVMRHKSVHMRIGELLKANFRQAVPNYLIEFVAGQDDWMKRTRELRYMGWDIKVSRRKTSTGVVESSYCLTKYRKWPQDPSRWIREYERRRAERGRSESGKN